MKILFLTVLGVWTASSQAAEPTLTTKQLAEDQYELEFVTDQTADVSAAQRSLLPAAQKLCAGKTVRFGHYKFESSESMPGQPAAPPKLTLWQQVHCESNSETTQTEVANLVPHNDQTIETLTSKYLTSRAAGNFAEAYSLLGPAMTNSTSLEGWSDNARKLAEKSGQIKSHRIKKITWYDNPPSASKPGTYAAADYETEAEGASIYCGYVAWYGYPNGEFKIIREELNFIDKVSAMKVGTEQLKLFAARYGCEVR